MPGQSVLQQVGILFPVDLLASRIIYRKTCRLPIHEMVYSSEAWVIEVRVSPKLYLYTTGGLLYDLFHNCQLTDMHTMS